MPQRAPAPTQSPCGQTAGKFVIRLGIIDIGPKSDRKPPANNTRPERATQAQRLGFVIGTGFARSRQIATITQLEGLEQTVAGAIGLLNVLAEFNPLWPCLVKVSADTSPAIAARIAEHERCDGLVISNAIKFGLLPDKIDWKALFGSATVSPLASLGAGGLSGAPLLPLVEAWVKAIRCLGMTKHINAGGGILHPRDVARLLDAGADSVFLGIIAMMRPWRMRGCIRTAYNKTWDPRPREKT